MRTAMDAYYVNRSVCTCLYISSFLGKEPRPDIFCLFLLRFFLLVCSKEDKELYSNKLKSFGKNILLHCKKWIGGGGRGDRGEAKAPSVRPATPCLASSIKFYSGCARSVTDKEMNGVKI